jgi:hypothetical protein
MNRRVTIHFNTATTEKIREDSNSPEFTCQVLDKVRDMRLLNSSSFLFISAASKEKTVDGLVEYYYNFDTIDRIKVVDLPS